MWLYVQRNGHLYHDGILETKAYAGCDAGKNNPAMQHVKSVGPLPCGRYKIGPSFTHPSKGVLSMRLEPMEPEKMFGRSMMMIHGDSIKSPGRASNGCICASRSARENVDKSEGEDRMLEVVADDPFMKGGA